MKLQLKVILLTAYLCMVFYAIGAVMIENEVNYRSWLWIGEQEFPAFHQVMDKLLVPFFKIPLTLCWVLSLVFVFYKPTRHLLLYFINFAILTYFLVFSLWIQVPIHEQLSERRSIELIETLIHNNTVYRLPAVLLLACNNIYLLYKCVKGGYFPNTK